MTRADEKEARGEEAYVGARRTRFGPITVLFGHRDGRYPDGNSLLVEGDDATAIIDPAVGLWSGARALPEVDLVINSHCHEDHIAGNALFPDAHCLLHEADAPGLADLDGMMAIYGMAGPVEDVFRQKVVDDFHYQPRPDAETFQEGDVFDLGGVEIEVLHTPGHTRGHCCLLIRWREDGHAPDDEDIENDRRLLYLGDIELTSFGPYYGDAWSNLEDFERSLTRVRAIEADWYATFHHIGVLDGREAFLERLDRFESKIESREQRLLEFLSEPRSLEDIVEYRFVYRPGDAIGWADNVERRSATQHIARWLEAGIVVEASDGRWVRATPN